ncbi:uncharacterized protein LOC127942689 isoform X2 [Carassius gibelio]|uniref:uncharacterized protein LOC127942689 isoform X2 n=1 Tax=Carassius gibelio TaxID=101364 RepID=UPI00227915DA|nr:uncharacterized protein LOC127942689 isoform X2 [Carassius gibelio]
MFSILRKEITEMTGKRSDSEASSSVSVKSDHSIGGVPDLSMETTSPAKRKRSVSETSSSVSVESDHSIGGVPDLSMETTSPAKSMKRSISETFSSVSVRSDHSIGGVPDLSMETTSSAERERSGSHVSSFVSMKSDHSKDGGTPKFSEKTTSTKSNKGHKTTVNIGSEITRWEALKAQKGMRSDVELATFLLNKIQHEQSDFQNYRFNIENLVWIFKMEEQTKQNNHKNTSPGQHNVMPTRAEQKTTTSVWSKQMPPRAEQKTTTSVRPHKQEDKSGWAMLKQKT